MFRNNLYEPHLDNASSANDNDSEDYIYNNDEDYFIYDPDDYKYFNNNEYNFIFLYIY